MKKVLFVINTLGGAGAERALLELLKRFTPDQYEVDLYILLEQGELISQVPEYVNILNRNYTAEDWTGTVTWTLTGSLQYQGK